MYPMRFINDLAQALVISMYPPDSTSKPPSLTEIMPFAALITIVSCVLYGAAQMQCPTCHLCVLHLRVNTH